MVASAERGEKGFVFPSLGADYDRRTILIGGGPLAKDDNGSFLLPFADFDNAVTFDGTREEALGHAVDAPETVTLLRIKHKPDIPAPSGGRGKAMVNIPPLTAAKALFYTQLRGQDVSIRQLALRLRTNIRLQIGCLM